MYAPPPYNAAYAGGGFDYTRTPPPPTSGGYYPRPPPRYATAFQAAGPSPRGSSGNPKAHARRASQQVPTGYQYNARIPPMYAADPRFHSSPLRPEHVSGHFDYEAYARGQTRSSRAPNAQRSGSGKADPRYYYSYLRYMYDVAAGDDYYDVYDAPPPYEAYPSKRAPTDHRYHDQDRSFPSQPPQAQPTTPKANQSRPRRASTYTRPQTAQPKSKPSPPKPSPRKATAEDAARAQIPAGYSIKNWDPQEEPIILLGSVFDANSLGKWIYDWTVYSYGAGSPMTDVAGDLWLLLIQLAGKVKRADETIEKIRREDHRELVEDFLESGERLWIRFKKLLKICEDFMWKAAQRDAPDGKPVTMGRESGCEFVESLFGRDRELDKTEKLSSNIRLWSMRFDANCDEILRNPSA